MRREIEMGSKMMTQMETEMGSQLETDKEMGS